MDVPLPPLPPHLVLYDGVCGLCDRTVQRLLELDREHKLRFAPLQGSTAAALRQRHAEIPTSLDSVVYVASIDGSESVHLRADAIVRIFAAIGHHSIWLSLAHRLPGWLNELAYRCVAATRYCLFGKFDSCRLPSPEVRDRFLA